MTAADTHAGAVARRAGFVVQGLSVLLVVVELGRTAVSGDAHSLLVGVLASVVFVPLHMQHLRYGLRGERPPRAALTLGVMAVAHGVAFAIIGQPWSFMLATLAVSGLVVLRPPWSLGLLLAIAVAPVAAGLAQRGDTFGNTSYLVYSVVFRTCIQIALIWLVAATHQLAAARAALAAQLVAAERARLEAQVRAAIERRLELLVGAARRARRALEDDDVARPLLALDSVLTLAHTALSDLRGIVAAPRAPRVGDPAEAPVARARAWRLMAMTHAVVLLFTPLSVLGAFGNPEPRHAVLSIVVWAAIAALLLWLSLRVGRGAARQPWAVACFVGAGLVAAALTPVFGEPWSLVVWLIGTLGVFALRGRARWLVVAGVLGVWVLDAALVPLPAMGVLGVELTNVWNVTYGATITCFVIGGIYGSARLVALVAELDLTREALAAQAAEAERRRLSSDLHDVLGQSLTALSLKGDLARRLVRTDRARAARELDELLVLASAQATEVGAVTSGRRAVDLDTEVRDAVGLLRGMGVEVDVVLEAGALDDATRTLLGFVVREGVTNVLRHASATHVRLLVARADDRLVLALHNDGVGPASDAPGIGLESLRGRLRAVGGELEATRDGDAFVLRVALPELVTA